MGVASSPDGPTGILSCGVITTLIPRLLIADLAIAFFFVQVSCQRARSDTSLIPRPFTIVAFFFCAGELSVSMPEVTLASFPGPLQL